MKEFNRNLKSLDNKTGDKIKKILNNMLNTHEIYKNSYFWNPPGNAAGRRNKEFTDYVSFIFNNKQYEWEQELSCSCKNVYWTNYISVDGKKKDIRTIKKLL